MSRSRTEASAAKRPQVTPAVRRACAENGKTERVKQPSTRSECLDDNYNVYILQVLVFLSSAPKITNSSRSMTLPQTFPAKGSTRQHAEGTT